MSPNRTIREQCRSSRTLDALSADAERLFWRLIVSADDWGRYLADADLVRATCFPLRADRIRLDRIRAWHGELERVDLVRVYQVGSRTYGVFVRWLDYQTRRAKFSKYPDPPPDLLADVSRCQHMLTNVSEDRGSRIENRGSNSEDRGAGATPDGVGLPDPAIAKATPDQVRRVRQMLAQAKLIRTDGPGDGVGEGGSR